MFRIFGPTRHPFARVLAAALLCLASAACAKPYILHANLTRDELSSRITANFPKGMTYQDLNAKLTELRVDEGVRRTYSPTPPREMMVRLFPPGGPWVTDPDQVIEWWDVTFSFDAQDRLVAARAFNGGARYVEGRPQNISPPPPPGPWTRYPQTIPAPQQPPPGEEIPLH
jgi:hypothetical protein